MLKCGILLLLMLAHPAFGDGINKPKKKVHKTVPVKKVTVIPQPKTPKPPSILTTKDMDLLASIEPKPLQPLLDIPALPPIVITTTETNTWTFDEDKKCKYCFFLLGAAVIPFLIPHGDEVPTPTPETHTTTTVPESTSILLLVVGVTFLAVKKGLQWQNEQRERRQL